MTDYRDKTFDGGVVRLDGNRFYNCRFVNQCVIQYGGEGSLHLEQCDFVSTQLMFVGSAGTTMQFINFAWNTYPTLRPALAQLLELVKMPPPPPQAPSTGDSKRTIN